VFTVRFEIPLLFSLFAHMKTTFFSLLLVFSYHLSGAQSKASLFKRMETILNKAAGKTVTRPDSGDPKNSPRFIVTKQVFRESQVAISFVYGQTTFIEEHSPINWTDACDYSFMEKDPNDSTLNRLNLPFEIEHTAKMLQNGKVYQEGKATDITVYFLASDRAELIELRKAMEKLQTAEQR
jgi:hypothetical protein